jgi:site-specific recombinase XerC
MVQRLLGHTKIETSKIYVSLDNDEIAENMAKLFEKQI